MNWNICDPLRIATVESMSDPRRVRTRTIARAAAKPFMVSRSRSASRTPRAQTFTR